MAIGVEVGITDDHATNHPRRFVRSMMVLVGMMHMISTDRTDVVVHSLFLEGPLERFAGGLVDIARPRLGTVRYPLLRSRR